MANSPKSLDEIHKELLADFGLPESAMPTLLMPPAAPLTSTSLKVYLDTNHWISLAKARVGHPDGVQYLECYEALLETTFSGRVCVVLSSANYMELQLAVRSARQRTNLADVMSELSRFRTIRPRSELLEAQVMQALHDRLGRPAFPGQPVVFGQGLMWAFNGRPGGLSLNGPPEALSELFNETNGANTLAMIAHVEETLEYLVLRGHAADDLAEMPVFDLNPIRDSEADRVRSFSQLEIQLEADPQLKTRLDDVLIARELYWELGPELPRLLRNAAMSVDSFFYKGKEWLTDFIQDLPTIAVQLAVRGQSLKSASRAWKVNDQRDIDHLGVSVPYCDVTVTDKAATNALLRAGLDTKFGHVVLDDLASLLELVRSV